MDNPYHVRVPLIPGPIDASPLSPETARQIRRADAALQDARMGDEGLHAALADLHATVARSRALRSLPASVPPGVAQDAP
jgi:hypothetical protein